MQIVHFDITLRNIALLLVSAMVVLGLFFIGLFSCAWGYKVGGLPGLALVMGIILILFTTWTNPLLRKRVIHGILSHNNS